VLRNVTSASLVMWSASRILIVKTTKKPARGGLVSTLATGKFLFPARRDQRVP
jgi:hypothetical protein